MKLLQELLESTDSNQKLIKVLTNNLSNHDEKADNMFKGMSEDKLELQFDSIDDESWVEKYFDKVSEYITDRFDSEFPEDFDINRANARAEKLGIDDPLGEYEGRAQDLFRNRFGIPEEYGRELASDLFREFEHRILNTHHS